MCAAVPVALRLQWVTDDCCLRLARWNKPQLTRNLRPGVVTRAELGSTLSSPNTVANDLRGQALMRYSPTGAKERELSGRGTTCRSAHLAARAAAPHTVFSPLGRWSCARCPAEVSMDVQHEESQAASAATSPHTHCSRPGRVLTCCSEGSCGSAGRVR